MTIDSHKGIELAFGEYEGVAVPDRGPRHLGYSPHLVANDVSREPPVNALVEENLDLTRLLACVAASAPVGSITPRAGPP